jgi:hypothetical protein
VAIKLVDETVVASDLLLDPNNPRFADLGVSKEIPAHKIPEDTVQQTALARMLDDRFEVDELQESIERVGFLNVDRMVVIELAEDGKYMVVEGNRRLAAIKSILVEVDSGEIELAGEVAASLKDLPVVVIHGGSLEERKDYARMLQGIRHIAGVRPWGPYQQAQAVGRMLEDGMDPKEIKSALGLPTPRVTLLRAVYLCMKQMREDPDYGSKARPELFSMFVEALNRPKIREWLGWNREAGLMENDEARRQFYQLITGMEDEEGQVQPPKIVDAKDFRLLPTIMEDASFFQDFLSNPTRSLQDAYRMYAPPPDPLPDWKSIIRRDLATLRHNVPHTAIRAASGDDVVLLSELRDLLSEFLSDIEAVQGS